MAVTAGVGTRQYRQELTADPERIGQVRRIVTAFTRYWGLDSELTASALICVTELLANVHRHADTGGCVLLVQTSDSGLRIVVSDHSPVLPVVVEPDWLAESGRGMAIVSATAYTWGAEPTSTGKDVWVELRPDAEEAA